MGEVSLRRIIKQQEQLILSLMDNMPGLVIFKDHDGCWLRANKEAVDIFKLNGYKYIGKHDSELAEHSNNPLAMFHCIGTDKATWEKGEKLIVEEKIGDTYWEVQKQPVYKEAYSKHGIIIISKNITEVKLVEQRLIEEFTNTSKTLFFDMGS